jgi:hypothetical protein
MPCSMPPTLSNGHSAIFPTLPPGGVRSRLVSSGMKDATRVRRPCRAPQRVAAVQGQAALDVSNHQMVRNPERMRPSAHQLQLRASDRHPPTWNWKIPASGRRAPSASPSSQQAGDCTSGMDACQPLLRTTTVNRPARGQATCQGPGSWRQHGRS